MPPEFKASIDEFVTENKIVVFMKGNREIPQCGFSNTVVQILNQLSVPYVTVDILENEMLRAGMKEYSMWWVLSLDRRALARTKSLTRSLAHSLTRYSLGSFARPTFPQVYVDGEFYGGY